MKLAVASIHYELPKGAWLVVMLLAVVGCLNYLDRTIITTMRESIVHAIPMSDGQFGLLTSVFLWVYGLISPFAGFLADRFGCSRVIIASLFLWSIVTWLTAYATSFEELLGTRILMGLSEACYIPAALALIVDYHRGSSRSTAVGVHMIGIMVGSGLGFLGGWVAERHHWNTIFVYLGIFGVIYSILLALLLRDRPKNSPWESSQQAVNNISFLSAIGYLFRLRSFILILSCWVLVSISSWLLVGWLPTYFQEHFNLSQGMAGIYATTYFFAAAILGLLLGGYWADRWSHSNPRARILVPAIGLCIASPGIFMASYTDILPVAIVCFMLYSFTKSFMDTNMMPILCLVVHPRYRATGYGILNLMACIVGGIGLYAGGALRDLNTNLSAIYKFAALIMIISIVILFCVKPKYIKPE